MIELFTVLVVTELFILKTFKRIKPFTFDSQPRSQGFSLFRGGGREKALASAGHVLVLNIHYNTNV